jgi:hypothetical protein
MTLHIGVQCKTASCPNAITFQEMSEPPNAINNPNVEVPFIAKCETCGESHSYGKDDLTVFEG